MVPTRCILIVAGHDPSGAGIDADLSALGDLDLAPLAVVTARTDQDERAVRSIGARDPREWMAEATGAVQAIGPARRRLAAVKFGLLPGAEHVRSARELLRGLRAREGADLAAVVDPVIWASSGARFLDAWAVEAVRSELAAEGVVLTPNLPEAAELSCVPLEALEESLSARIEAARILLALGAAGVVIKGGHGREDPVRDLVARAGGTHVWHGRPRFFGGAMRGSGCRFATRLAAELALGSQLELAAQRAGEFVAAAIARASTARGEPER